MNTKLLYFRIVAFCLCAFGIGYRLLSPLWGENPLHSLDMFGYFTIQSGILVCLLFAHLIVGQLKAKGDSSLKPIFRGAVLLYILITAIIFLLLLNNRVDESGLGKIILYVNHGLSALLLLIDSFLSIPPKSYHYKDAFKWLLYPLLYYIFALFELHFFKRARYFFIDYAKQGLNVHILTLAVMVAFFILLGFAIVFINQNKKIPHE